MLKERLEELSIEELVHIYNTICEECNYYEDRWYHQSEFDEIMRDETPMELALKIHFGDYNPFHKWWRFDRNYNLESMEDYMLEGDLISGIIAEGIDSLPHELIEYYNLEA